MGGIMRRVLVGAVSVCLVGIFAFLYWPIELETDGGESDLPPKLVVLVVFDQLRGDYLSRWETLYGEGGFKRLLKDGAWFTDCHYPYAYTLTGPGHASLATGCSAEKHGIVSNEWYSRADGAMVNCVEPPPNEKRQGLGPYRRKQDSFGDSLMGVSKKSKVAALSIKDRAAILLAALRAQICYWLDPRSGNFVTSPYYREEPHGWVKDFNKARLVDTWLGKSWDRLRPKMDYAPFSGPDDFPAEGTGYEQGQVFPHPFVMGRDEKNPSYFNAVACSPMGNELLLALAKRAIEAEQLGQRDAVDVLCLGFSCNDLVGHCWGPDSQEVLDITLRTDELLKDFMDYLDTRIGKGRYVLALSSDHGICPLPEFARRQGKESGRVLPSLLTSQSEAFLNKHFLKDGQKAGWLEAPKNANEWVYLNGATIKELGLTQAEVETALADWLSKQPGVEAAFTRSELLKGPSPTALGRMVQKSFHPEESGDVMIVLKPYHILSPALDSPRTAAYRTTHGSPHPYDTHVPLIVMGPGIIPGVRSERVTPQAMASILARAMGAPPPRGAEAHVPGGLFR